MKNLLGTELGYHSMKMMCNILNDYKLYDDDYLLRGAVFHLNMNIFNAPVDFQVSPLFYASMVLNSFLRVSFINFEFLLTSLAHDFKL